MKIYVPGFSRRLHRVRASTHIHDDGLSVPLLSPFACVAVSQKTSQKRGTSSEDDGWYKQSIRLEYFLVSPLFRRFFVLKTLPERVCRTDRGSSLMNGRNKEKKQNREQCVLPGQAFHHRSFDHQERDKKRFSLGAVFWHGNSRSVNIPFRVPFPSETRIHSSCSKTFLSTSHPYFKKDIVEERARTRLLLQSFSCP